MKEQRKPDVRDRQRASEVAQARKRAGVSQSALAYHLGLSSQQLSKYELGINRMSISVYERALEYLEHRLRPVSGLSEGEQEPFHSERPSRHDLKTLLLRARRDIDLCLEQLEAE